MDKSQESVLFPFVIFMALISLSRSDSILTVIEGEVAKLEFPYPCDRSRVTIQKANGAPFYNSVEPGDLNLLAYQLNRFRVEDKNCSLQVQINPVLRDDQATYVCLAYKDGVNLEVIRTRLNVDYSPGRVSCEPIGEDAVGDWALLQCEASVGSLAGEIVCYQDAKRMPPFHQLVQNGEILEQTIWVKKEYPAFCCSSVLDQPKDICDCKDFAWDPSGSEINKDPCPASTSGQDMTSQEISESQTTQNLRENDEDHHSPETVSPTMGNKSSTNFWVLMIMISVLLFLTVFLMIQYLCQKFVKNNTHVVTEKMDEHPEATELMQVHEHDERRVDRASQTEKKLFSHISRTNERKSNA